MPGRTKMAKRVTELFERAKALNKDLWSLFPAEHLKDDHGPDPLGLGEAWRDAAFGVGEARMTLEELSDTLQQG